MHTVRELYRSPALFVGDVTCRAGRSGFGGVELAASPTVILPRSGVFVGRLRGNPVVCDPNHAVFLDRGETYRVSHPVDGGDRCTVICFGESLLRELLDACESRAADDAAPGFEISHAATDAATDDAHRRLASRLDRHREDEDGIEETLVALLGRIVETACGRRDRVPDARGATLARQRALAEATKEILASRFAERGLPLDELAAELDCSTYHLARVFRRHAGTTIHRYRRRLRVRAAQERIAGGERNLSRLALDLGFADHAHLTRAFGDETGSTPRAFRSSLGPRTREEIP